MEDLKQIQEFFSKPLNENVFVEAFKFEKALKSMGYDVKVKHVDDFGESIFEIYFNNPADADESIFYDAKKLGYDNVRVFANPNESLNENEDPIIVKYFKRGDEYFQILVKYERPTGFTTALGSRTATGQRIDQNEAAAQERVEAIVNKLKADFDLDEIFVEKGQVAGRYYINAFSDDFREMDVNDLEGFYTLEEANLNDPVLMRMRAEKDKLAKMRAANAGDDGNDKFFDAAKLRALKKKRAQIMRDMEQEAEMEGGPVADKYGDMLNKIDKAIAMLSEYNTGLYYDPAKERNAVKAKQASKSGLEKVRDFVKKVMKEEEITVDDTTEFKLNLKHLLDKHVVKSEALSDHEEEEANYDELYGDYKYKVDEAKPKKGHGEKISKEVFSKLKGKTINYKGADYKVIDSDEAVLKIKHLKDGDVTTINLRQFNVSGMIEEILETIELGRQLDEKKLCKKGRAYRKRRMAAGEKSSAYLSGRAVKVCKGQISGRSKRKKRRRKK